LAAGLQLDVRVEELPEVIEAGDAVNVQVGVGVAAAVVVPTTATLSPEQLLAASQAAI
jgi:hypothetical protein